MQLIINKNSNKSIASTIIVLKWIHKYNTSQFPTNFRFPNILVIPCRKLLFLREKLIFHKIIFHVNACETQL